MKFPKWLSIHVHKQPQPEQPVDNVYNEPSRTFREVRVRPLRQGGMEKLKNSFQAQEWGEVLKEESVDKKAEILHNMNLEKVDEFCPEKQENLPVMTSHGS